MNNESHLIRASQAFIILGRDPRPTGFPGDGVLLQSIEATTELVGFARASLDKSTSKLRYRRSALPIFDSGTSELHMVRSRPIWHPKTRSDSEPSTYMLAWQGRIRVTDERAIEEALNKNLPDILSAYERNQPSAIEFSVSEVLYTLYQAKLRATVRHRQLLSVAIIYIVALFFIGVFFVLRFAGG
jgi:hypothetical protein